LLQKITSKGISKFAYNVVASAEVERESNCKYIGKNNLMGYLKGRGRG
jgi:hypothetical protein